MSKQYWLRQHKFAIQRQRLALFKPPVCLTCGHTAVIVLEPDGACGDPACCAQTDHVEILCPNKDCETTSENV